MIDTTRDSAVPSVCLITMGCAKNEVDSAAMARRLREAGFSVTEEASSADAIIVNTCSFIQAATEESIDAIFEAASLPKVDEGSAVLIVAGCMPARYGDDLAAELTGDDAAVLALGPDAARPERFGDATDLLLRWARGLICGL